MSFQHICRAGFGGIINTSGVGIRKKPGYPKGSWPLLGVKITGRQTTNCEDGIQKLLDLAVCASYVQVRGGQAAAATDRATDTPSE